MTETVEDVFAAADHGRFGTAMSALERTLEPGARIAIESILAAAGAARAPSIDVLAGALPSGTDHLLRATEELFVLALAAFDAPGRALLLPLAARFAEPLGEQGDMRRERLALWDRVARGEDVRGQSDELRKRAARHELSGLVVEAETLQAWSAIVAGDLEDARRLARVASRMASAERLLVPECLAHIALAHVRRAFGKPHLAARILAGLRKTAPAPWHAWIDWELGLAGGAPSPLVELLFSSARAGDHAHFDGARAELEGRTSGFAPALREVAKLAEALDPREAITSGFVRGTSAHDGFLWAERGDDDGTLAYVLVRPATGSRRVLTSGAGFLPALEVVGLGASQSHRALELLCELALGGPLALPDLFARVYGFPYVAGRHAGAFRVTLHRARSLASDVAGVERDGEETFRLEPHTAFFLSDPRCRLALDERVLSALGHRPASAAELASQLGVTARAVQRVLRRLAEDGLCEGRSEGRGLLYRVIDTTFTEPSFLPDLRPS